MQPRCVRQRARLGGFGACSPKEKFEVLGSQRLILLHFKPFYEGVQSLVASPVARGVARS